MVNFSRSARKLREYQAQTWRELLRRYGFVWLPLPILFLAIVTLWLKDVQAPHESVGVLVALNLLLLTLPALGIAFLFARSFLITGALGVCLFSCGAVLWSASGLGALGATMPQLFTVNTYVTIHNLNVWAVSLCYLAGAALLLRGRFIVKARAATLLAAYVLALTTAAFIALISIRGWTPAFFVQGQGATAERQIVLASTIFTILLTLLLIRRGMDIRSPFATWCAFALMLLAIAYMGFMLQTTVGGALGWVSRAAQYLGGAYMLVAAYTAFRDAEAPFAIQAPPQEKPPYPYAVAIAIVLIAAVLRVALLSTLGDTHSFVTYYPAVMLAALYGGLRAGALATLLVVALVPSPLPPDLAWPQDWPALLIFMVTCLLIALVAELMQKAQTRLRRSEAERRAELERMVAELQSAKTKAESASAELKAVFDSAPAAIWLARDPSCRTMQGNRLGNAWMHIPEGANASRTGPDTGRIRFEVFDKGGLPVLGDQLPMQRASRGEEVKDCELEWRFEDGERRNLFGNATPLRDAGGNVTGAVGAFIDITERKLAEDALRQSQERLVAALRAGKLGVYDYDPRTRRAKWSPEVFRMAGVPEGEEVTYEVVEAVVHPGDVEAFKASVQAAFDPAGSHRYEYEYRVVNQADGSIHWVFADADVTFEGRQPVRLVGTVQDITERKQREEQLSRLSAFNEAALRSIGEGLYTIDEQGLVTFMNPAAEELLGWSLAELRGKNMHSVIHHHNRDGRPLPACECASLQVLKYGRPLKNGEDVFIRKDGAFFDVVRTSNPLRDDTGKITGSIEVFSDITDRKLAENALRESQERLAAALRAGKLGVYDYDPRTGRVKWSGETYRLWGVPEEEEVTYETVQAGVHPGHLEAFKAALQGALDPAGSHRYECEYRIVNRADGSIHWVFVDGDVTFEGGQPVRIVGTVQDITERKLTEIALRESQDWLAAALRAGKLGVYHFDPRTGRAKWSPEIHRLWGVPERQEVAYEIIEAGVHPDDAEAFKANVQAAFDPAGSHRHECEYRVVNRADGSIRWVFADGDVAFERGQPVRLVGTVQDITERKQREEQLRRLAAFNEAALTSIGEGLYTLDEQGLVTFMNPAAEDLLGWNFAELRGKSMHRMIHHHCRDGQSFPSCECAALQVLTNGAPLKNHEAVFIRKDGTFFDVMFTVTPLRDGAGKITGSIEVFSDITERKLAEAALRESQERLAAALRAGKLGVYDYDPRTGQLKWSPETYRLWGVPEDREATYEIFEAGIHPEDLETVRATIEGSLDPSGARHQQCEYRVVSQADGSVRWVLADADAVFEGGQAVRLVGAVQDITERKRAQERIHLLMREVNHRSKNMLTVVQAIARQTIANSPEEFLERFGDRVQALAASQDLLVKSAWKGVALEELIRSQLALFKDLIGDRIILQGPAVLVSASAAQTLGMALHELATNAGKYGALSSHEGRVQVEWRVQPANGAEATFSIIWRESGGPAVEPPKRRGFGRVIISRTPEMSLEAKVDLDFAVTGLSWRLRCPAERVVEGSLPAPDLANFSQRAGGAAMDSKVISRMAPAV